MSTANGKVILAYSGGLDTTAIIPWLKENYGFDVLNRTLRLIVGTWEGEDLSLSSNMISGVAKLIATYGDKLDDDAFKERLGKISCKELNRTAKERGSGSMGYAEAIVNYYNKRTRFGLSIYELYGKNNKKEAVYDDLDNTENEDEITVS